MIQLKEVKKTYKSKKGKNTKALDGVTLTLEEKGVTFILGKSGSGKSTLLNVLGGLDKYDEGDIVIYGKSSKEFKQADFDSYRNTYIGFIFQEFNILEDYDVYQNIVLALQLQQKEINEKEIDTLLDKLELTDLKNRRVNELSGGQKQRVAIARALIKDPKIILADEPTGNLDSKTGNGVMELLKEISKEKLVVIVSHDEEYAKTYGDRIIEISDGKVVKDTKNVKEKEEENHYKIIKSKLPMKDSFKLGSGSLKHKKVKLFFTILLTIVALGFLFCADTLSCYNYEKEHASALKKGKEPFIQIQKTKTIKFNGFSETINLSLEKEDEDEINKKMKKEGYRVYQYVNGSSFQDIMQIHDKQYDNIIPDIVVGDTTFLDVELKGEKPKGNGIVISSYIADKIIQNGVEVWEKTEDSEFKTSNMFQPKDYDEILTSKYTYYFGYETKVKIVGILLYDYKGKTAKYKENVLNKVYVAEDFTTSIKTQHVSSIKEYIGANVKIKDTKLTDYINTNVLDKKIEYFDGKKWHKKDSIEKDEVIVSLQCLLTEENHYNEDLNNYISKKQQQDWSVSYETLARKFFENYVKQIHIIGKDVTLDLFYSNYGQKGDKLEHFTNLKVVGVYMDDSYENANYFSKDLIGKYKMDAFEEVALLYPIKDEYKKLMKTFPLSEQYFVKSSYSETLLTEKDIFNVISKLSFYASIIFLVFSIILIANFMFTSISYRKKEIGILRALGSRNTDVIKIFLWEAIVLSLIAGTIASILLVIVSNFLNHYIMDLIHVITTPFAVGIRQFIVIYGLVFIINIVSSLLPILKISKMKPIDAILNK